eukprot:TRINITY_DN15288_c0_g1_i1.p1 TRINITY_DN15288_c0_g1~~TRINITY_DN15288_c0_g1_i1.p1  ORF type:complete len:254 (-),score=56.72 TRINITY_DN15288_c0_g1_i1:17-733(-)
MVKIGILGSGQVGGELGKVLAQRGGHNIIFGTRTPGKPEVEALVAATPRSTSASNAEVAAAADILILATPWAAVEPLLRELNPESTRGKVLIDATNPIKYGGPALVLDPSAGTATSGGEIVQKLAPLARVVKCFNTIGFNHYAHPTTSAGISKDMYISADDADAAGKVADLCYEMGFTPVLIGKLLTARFTEPLAMVWITLVMPPNMGGQGIGRDHAFKLLDLPEKAVIPRAGARAKQ